MLRSCSFGNSWAIATADRARAEARDQSNEQPGAHLAARQRSQSQLAQRSVAVTPHRELAGAEETQPERGLARAQRLEAVDRTSEELDGQGHERSCDHRGNRPEDRGCRRPAWRARDCAEGGSTSVRGRAPRRRSRSIRSRSTIAPASSPTDRGTTPRAAKRRRGSMRSPGPRRAAGRRARGRREPCHSCGTPAWVRRSSSTRHAPRRSTRRAGTPTQGSRHTPASLVAPDPSVRSVPPDAALSLYRTDPLPRGGGGVNVSDDEHEVGASDEPIEPRALAGSSVPPPPMPLPPPPAPAAAVPPPPPSPYLAPTVPGAAMTAPPPSTPVTAVRWHGHQGADHRADGVLLARRHGARCSE